MILHCGLLRGVLSGPLGFFDVTPSGRILSRFSSDIETVDNRLPTFVVDCIDCMFEVRKLFRFLMINISHLRPKT